MKRVYRLIIAQMVLLPMWGCAERNSGGDVALDSQEIQMEVFRHRALAGDADAEVELRKMLTSLGRELSMDLMSYASENGQRFPRSLNELPPPSGSGLERERFDYVAAGLDLNADIPREQTPLIVLKGDYPWQLVFSVDGAAWFLDLSDPASRKRYEEMMGRVEAGVLASGIGSTKGFWFNRRSAIPEMVYQFRQAAQRDCLGAVEQIGAAALKQRFQEFEDALWPTVDPQLGWRYFFETSLVCLGRVAPAGPVVVAYYHPWSEVFLLTVWQRESNGEVRLADAEVLMGTFLARRGRPPFEASRSWQGGDQYRALQVGMSTVWHLRLFEELFRESRPAGANWREAIPGLADAALVEKNRFGAGLLLLANLREIIAASVAEPQDEASAAYRAAWLRFQRESNQGWGMGELMDEARNTLPETRAALGSLTLGTWSQFRLVSYLPGSSACLMMFSRTDQADQYLSVLLSRHGSEARFDRMDLLSFQALYEEYRNVQIVASDPQP